MNSLTYRLLIDHRPAPASLLETAESLEVEQRSDAAAMFRLRLPLSQSQIGRYHPLDDGLFRPLTPVAVQVSLGPTPGLTLINGFVSAVRADYGEAPTLEVVGMDHTATVMNLEEKVRAWPNMADSDIAAMIFSEYGITAQVTPTQPIRMAGDTTVIQRGTDIRFLRTLAERNGFECSVTTAPLAPVPAGYFGPPRAAEPPQATLSVNFGTETNVTGFAVHYDMLTPAAARIANIDAADGSSQDADVTELGVAKLGADSTLEHLDHPSLILLSRSGLVTGDELQTYAQGQVDRTAWAVTAEGTADPRRLGALLEVGRPVLVRGAGSLFSGAYLVDRVLHGWSAEGYSMRFRLRRNATGLKGTEVFR